MLQCRSHGKKYYLTEDRISPILFLYGLKDYVLQKSQKCILKVLPNLIWFNLERLTKKERKKKKNRENLQTNNFSRTTKFYQFPDTIFNLYFYNLINIYFLHEFVWFHHDLIDTYLQITYIKRRKNKKIGRKK